MSIERPPGLSQGAWAASRYRDTGAPPPDIATQAELQQRIAQRAKAEAKLPPPAPSAQERLNVNRAMSEQNETRIADLDRALKRADKAFNRDISYVANKGRAKTHFGYGR